MNILIGTTFRCGSDFMKDVARLSPHDETTWQYDELDIDRTGFSLVKYTFNDITTWQYDELD